jgi:hypothetical protein
MSSDFPKWRIEWDWIRWPHWQELSALSNEIKNKLIARFTILDRNYSQNNFISNPYKVSIERLKEIPNSNWETMIYEVNKMSEERNLDFLKMVPSYKNYLGNNNEA